MNTDVLSLKPLSVWNHFAALSAIPRCSGHEAAALDHLKELFERWGLTWRQDKVGNLAVSKPASPGREGRPALVLQGHVDMVCEQNRGRGHDFSCDPLELIVEDGWVRADQTTLGADNGVGVALILGILESRDLVHGPLEALFTVDEETALTGALQLDPSLISGKLLVNLDSEDLGHFTVGCAGGMTTTATVPVETEQGGPTGFVFQLKGLPGGHSGVNIHEQRGNALKLAARFLSEFFAVNEGWRLASFEGGDKHNAIPREAALTLTGPIGGLGTLKTFAAQKFPVYSRELGAQGLSLSWDAEETPSPSLVLTQASQARALNLVSALPDGVQGMSKIVPGLVETSCNLAAVKLSSEGFRLVLSQRSSLESLRDELGRRIGAAVSLAGGSVVHGDGYPAWPPQEKSPLRDLCVRIWNDGVRKPALVELVHAGLECGVIGDKRPGMDMISFGPDIQGAHTPQERVKVESVAEVWGFLASLLKEL